jgi:hypothetical protein
LIPARIVCAMHFCAAAAGAASLAHGLWIWKSQDVLEAPRATDALLQFCKSKSIDEVYISFPAGGEKRVSPIVKLLHRSSIRVEVLLSSGDAGEPGPKRDKLLDRVEAIVQFNRQHPNEPFDGIHLDLEPQQQPENKGPGNLRFLPALAGTYRAVRALAESGRMSVDADIPTKYLKGTLGERRMLLSALPRLTLMLYELSRPDDGRSESQKAGKLRQEAARYLEMAYRGLDTPDLAKISVALRTPDYGGLLPAMFKALDAAMAGNPHYGGWAWHSYNDMLSR